MVIFNIAFMALVATAIVALLTWSVVTQYRHYGCEGMRFSGRPQLRIRVAFLRRPERPPKAAIAREI